jgi:photosystem II stability/assembly factor-like uncharacterized protein
MYLALLGNLAGSGSQQATVVRSLDAGHRWRRLADPCGSSRSGFAAISFAAAPGGVLAALCSTRSGESTPFVVTSTSYGATWSQRDWLPRDARHMQQIATPQPGVLVLANGPTGGSGSFTYRLAYSTEDGHHWTQIIADTEPVPETVTASPSPSLAFPSPLIGHWIAGDRTLWTTRDGGKTWTRAPLP